MFSQSKAKFRNILHRVNGGKGGQQQKYLKLQPRMRKNCKNIQKAKWEKIMFVMFRSGKTYTFESETLNLFTMEPSSSPFFTPTANNTSGVGCRGGEDDVGGKSKSSNKLPSNEKRIHFVLPDFHATIYLNKCVPWVLGVFKLHDTKDSYQMSTGDSASDILLNN